jgi:hypothetical protein
MTTTLKKWFAIMLAPALVGIAGAWLLRMFGIIDPNSLPGAFWAPGLFILSVATAGAAPILIRTLFAHRMQHQRQVSEDDFLRFQRLQLSVAMATPYLALAAYALAIPGFYLAGTVLAMLYALYYHYPSNRRLVFDRRIFRVR